MNYHHYKFFLPLVQINGIKIKGVMVSVIRWILGLFILLGGIGGCASEEFGYGVILTILGLVIIPPTSKWFYKKKNKSEVSTSNNLTKTSSQRKITSSTTKKTESGYTSTITINTGAILENILESRQQREAEIQNYDYQYMTVRGRGLQLLESVNLLGTTKNFDTLKGRYEFINTFYDDLLLAKHNSRYTTDIQQATDSFKSTYYETTLNDYEIDLLYNPDHDKLKKYYLKCIANCFNEFSIEQDNTISNLKRDNAKQNRLKKVEEIANDSLSEIDRVNLKDELTSEVVTRIRELRDDLLKKYNYSDQTNLAILSSNNLVVNPKSSFPITLCNAPKKYLKQAAVILKNEEYRKVADLFPLFAEHNIACIEIDAYIAKYKPIYLSHIQRAKDESAEYQTASEMDKNDLEQEFKEKAVTLLYEQAECDLQYLFDYNEIDVTVDDELLKDYGFENVSKYMKLQNKVGKVITTWERKQFEELATTDLISTIDEIDLDEILFTLPLKKLNAIAEKEVGHFKRKKAAVAYINVENLGHNIGNLVATRKIFKVNPLPSKYANVNIKEIANSWAYLKEYLSLLERTHREGEDNYEQLNRTSSWVHNWIVEPGYNCTCLRAAEECKESYTRSNPPKMPFHVGCNCRLRGEMKKD